MSPEARIAELEAEVRSLRLIAEGQAAALRSANHRLEQEGNAAQVLASRREAARIRKQNQRALKRLEDPVSRDPVSTVSQGQARDERGTPPPSFPSSFPPSSEPSSSYPLSFPPSPSSPPASQAPPVLALVEPAPNKPAKPRRPPTEPTDPRHRPLARALEAIGFPFRGGIDAKAVSNLLALADRLGPAEAAPAEVLRRAHIGWAWVGFPACKSLTELHANWGHYARAPPGGAATSITKANDPGWVTS